MRIQAVSALLLVAIASSGPGCSRSSRDDGGRTLAASVPTQADPNVPLIALTMTDNGKSIDLDEVHLLKIVLPSYGSMGKVWRMKSPRPQNLRLVKEAFLNESGLAGSPDTQVLYFGANSSGAGTLELDYGIPGRAPVNRFTITVRTTGAFTGQLGWKGPSGTSTAFSSSQAVGGDQLVASPLTTLPSYYDVCQNMGGCTPIKNQLCGDCWAHATVGTLEQAIKQHDGIVENLSEQYLVSCNSDGMTCSAGWFAHDYHQNKYITGETEAGAVWDSEFPETGQNTACNAPHGHREQISSWGYVDVSNSSTAVTNIKNAIYTYGAVASVVCAGSNFSAYTGGVFSTSDTCLDAGGNPTVNHLIVLVGWDDSLGVWHLRNSWGTTWGESGYMRIAWGTSRVGSYTSYVVYNPASSGSCPTGQWCYGRCEDVLSNKFDCGACGVTCSGTIANGYQACTNGQCGFICNAGYTMCSGACVNLSNDKRNCGRCGNICSDLQLNADGLPHGAVNCVSSCCTATCENPPAGSTSVAGGSWAVDYTPTL